MKTKALVILSGGQDSTTCLFWAQKEYDEVYAISFRYNQRHSYELVAARAVARLAGVVSHEFIDIPNCLVSTSPLTDSAAELKQYNNIEEMTGTEQEETFVPMRNQLFLTIAANRAVALGIRDIVIGVCGNDAAQYDDCRAPFIAAMHRTINLALGNDHRGSPYIRVVTPLLYSNKVATVHLAKDLPGCWSALAFTHTCYAGAYPPCGRCHACVLRAAGFEEAGYPDPLTEEWEHRYEL